MAQQEKAFAAKCGDLSSIPGKHMVEERTTSFVSSNAWVPWHIRAHGTHSK